MKWAIYPNLEFLSLLFQNSLILTQREILCRMGLLFIKCMWMVKHIFIYLYIFNMGLQDVSHQWWQTLLGLITQSWCTKFEYANIQIAQMRFESKIVNAQHLFHIQVYCSYSELWIIHIIFMTLLTCFIHFFILTALPLSLYRNKISISNRFRITWGWVNNDRIFNWTICLILWLFS